MNSLSATMRNGEEGVSYRLVFLSGSTAAKTVNFVNGTASDSSAFSTEGNYTIALVAGNTVLQQYASLRVGNPPAQTYTLSGSIQNNPGSSAIIFTVDGNVVASGSQVEEGKTVHVEITNASENWQAFTVNNMTKVTTLSGTSRVVDFVMPSANAVCVASFSAPTPAGQIQQVAYGDPDLTDPATNPNGTYSYNLEGAVRPTITFVSGDGAYFAWEDVNTGTTSQVTAISSSPQQISNPAAGTYHLVVMDSNNDIIERFGTFTAVA